MSTPTLRSTGIHSPVAGAASNPGGGTVTAGGVNYTYQNGQWVGPQGQVYSPQTTDGSATTSATQSTTMSAKAIITQTLASYGLSDLADWAWNTYLNSGSTDYVWSQLPQQKAFQARFPAYQQLAQEGRGITVADYVNYEKATYSLAQANGLPQGFVTQDEISKSLLAGVSTSELQQRFNDAGKIVNQLPAEDLEYLQREVGLSKGDLAAYWIDPSKALPVLENKLAAAQVGGAAARAGIDLGQGTANSLAANGVSASQANQGFNQLANDQQLFAALPGQQGQTLNQDQQVGAVFSTNAQAAQQVAQTAAQRQATFKAGGSFAGSSTGFTGAGSAAATKA